ncbi:MAG: DUF917 family protein [candidate division KSB1 bacterium]|nr:DUF917 family protein [candidate division KSB1 bacterium]
MMKVTTEIARHAVLGGALLGGGGGGSIEMGMALARQALAQGPLHLWHIDELPPHATVITVSLVGAPAAARQYVTADHFVRAVTLLRDKVDLRIDAMVTSENGGFATVNGWYQSAVLGLPVVDAPCNGRAHPLGLMGSMGLHLRPGYQAHAAVVGGDTSAGRFVEQVYSGSLQEVSQLVRRAAIEAGGMVAVARNPVEASWVRTHAAVGGISQAIALGAILRENVQAPARLQALAERTGAQVLATGKVEALRRHTGDGFDTGSVVMSAGTDLYELSFFNEYIAVERAGQRLATFPDLIATLEQDTLCPLTTAAIEPGRDIVLVVIPWTHLCLGAGMKDPKLYAEVSKAVGMEVPLPAGLVGER